MSIAAQKLREHLAPYKTHKFGFSTDDASVLEPTDKLFSLVADALAEGDQMGISLSGIVLEGLASRGTLWRHPGIENALWACVERAESRCVESALRTLGMLGLPAYATHKSTFSRALDSIEPHVRQAAIEASTKATVLDNKTRYLAFESDPHIAEPAMADPMRFMLRDLAVEKLSELFGVDLRGGEAVENHPTHGPVFWWKWNKPERVFPRLPK